MFGFIGNIGPWEIVLILLIALIVFGPGKLPDVAKGLGKALNEFKKSSSGLQKQFQDAINDEPPVQAKAPTQEDPPIEVKITTQDPPIETKAQAQEEPPKPTEGDPKVG